MQKIMPNPLWWELFLEGKAEQQRTKQIVQQIWNVRTHELSKKDYYSCILLAGKYFNGLRNLQQQHH